jgi:hypothetical protein
MRRRTGSGLCDTEHCAPRRKRLAAAGFAYDTSVCYRTESPAKPAQTARGACPSESKGNEMTLGSILLVVLVLLMIGSLPNWGHSKTWGYGPSSGAGIALLVVVVLLLSGRL